MHGQNVTKWEKEHKIHQVTMSQWNKMLFRGKMAQFMGKIGHKTCQEKLLPRDAM
jgi:hypothetical protein